MECPHAPAMYGVAMYQVRAKVGLKSGTEVFLKQRFDGIIPMKTLHFSNHFAKSSLCKRVVKIDQNFLPGNMINITAPTGAQK